MAKVSELIKLFILHENKSKRKLYLYKTIISTDPLASKNYLWNTDEEMEWMGGWDSDTKLSDS